VPTGPCRTTTSSGPSSQWPIGTARSGGSAGSTDTSAGRGSGCAGPLPSPAVLARASGVLCEVVDGQATLLDADGAHLVVLNQVGTLIWEALEVPSDQAALTAAVLGRVRGVGSADVAGDVAAFVDQLRSAGLVVPVS
jgi:hypothetical protein